MSKFAFVPAVKIPYIKVPTYPPVKVTYRSMEKKWKCRLRRALSHITYLHLYKVCQSFSILFLVVATTLY